MTAGGPLGVKQSGSSTRLRKGSARWTTERPGFPPSPPPPGTTYCNKSPDTRCKKAHITAADGRAGVARSGVKPTANPSVMVCMDPPRYGFAALPADEHVTAFRVLVSVFSVADTRPGRRTARASAGTLGTTCLLPSRSRSCGTTSLSAAFSRWVAES
ncbi:DUF5958 family protein [Streptomyces sp. NPDC058662]|uniref:DUF5958 family protein n=1 Tax=Streptomyces sp. NPDC058662 TaxID=3346583 RepID=UPI003665B932